MLLAMEKLSTKPIIIAFFEKERGADGYHRALVTPSPSRLLYALSGRAPDGILTLVFEWTGESANTRP